MICPFRGDGQHLRCTSTIRTTTKWTSIPSQSCLRSAYRAKSLTLVWMPCKSRLPPCIATSDRLCQAPCPRRSKSSSKLAGTRTQRRGHSLRASSSSCAPLSARQRKPRPHHPRAIHSVPRSTNRMSGPLPHPRVPDRCLRVMAPAAPCGRRVVRRPQWAQWDERGLVRPKAKVAFAASLREAQMRPPVTRPAGCQVGV